MPDSPHIVQAGGKLFLKLSLTSISCLESTLGLNNKAGLFLTSSATGLHPLQDPHISTSALSRLHKKQRSFTGRRCFLCSCLICASYSLGNTLWCLSNIARSVVMPVRQAFSGEGNAVPCFDHGCRAWGKFGTHLSLQDAVVLHIGPDLGYWCVKKRSDGCFDF